VVTIVQSTALVAGLDTEASTVQVQIGGPSALTKIPQFEGFAQSTIVEQFGGIAGYGDVLQFTGAAQDTHIVTPSQFSTSEDVPILLFPKSFNRGTFLIGVVGSSGTVEEFFDRSPFFFTPSETDPNTLRDISEAEQFLIFTQTTIGSYDPYRNTPSETIIIADRGEEGSSSSEKTEIITNGSFEQALSGWTVSGTNGTNTVTTVTQAPTGIGWGGAPLPLPTDGSRMASVEARFPSPAIVLFQEFAFGTRRVNSSQLEALGFDYAISQPTANSDFQVNIIFYLGTTQKANLQYRVSGLGAPEQPSGVTTAPIIAKTLTGFTSDVFNSVSRNLKSDLDSTFDFDKIETWFIFDEQSGGTGLLLDNIGLTVNIPQPQLLKTNEIAHVNTAHPIGTKQFGLETLPLTISGADDIFQVDLSAPFFAGLDPASGTVNVPETTDLIFHIQDISSSIDQGTINVYQDGLQIITAGVTITGSQYPVAFKTVLAPNDIEYEFRPASGYFVPGETVNVSGSFADFAAVSNFGEGAYSFDVVGSGGLGATISGAPDLLPPVIVATEPASSATQVSPNTDILFTITDDASGVDPSTVKLLLNGATKIQNDTATGGTFSRVSNTSLGYDYTYNSDGQFTFGETVTGTIQASDFAGNSSSLNYEFTITSSDTLEIENFFLGLDQSAPLTTGTIASVCVTDADFGVASGTTYMTVNGVVPSGLVTTFSGVASSGIAPAKMIFEVPLEPLVDFRRDLVFLVHAENEFPGSYPVIKEQQFTLRPGYNVNWPNKTEDAEGGPETIFPYVTNVQVLAEVLNYAKNFGQASAFFRVLTEGQHRANLGASIVSNIQTADLSAVTESINPFFEYGKTMILEIRASDLEGNEFSLTHTFTIESKP
jgi:hypothetical protein